MSSPLLHNFPIPPHRHLTRIELHILHDFGNIRFNRLLEGCNALPQHDGLDVDAGRVVGLELDDGPGFHAQRTPVLVDDRHVGVEVVVELCEGGCEGWGWDGREGFGLTSNFAPSLRG